ncbi:MAG: nucleotide exchange factor GrpE [Euryarchaeota archaeon]|nr:nucleotide exchange factor GrpE [Euryarchaeota archaeon]
MGKDNKNGNDRTNAFRERLQQLQSGVKGGIESVESELDKLIGIRGKLRGIATELERTTTNLDGKEEDVEPDEIGDAIEILEDEFAAKKRDLTFLYQDEESKKADERTAELQYLQAEFENYKRRAEKDKRDFGDYILKGFIAELLPIKDYLELAIAHASDNNESEGLVKGVEMTVKQFNELLEREGLEEIKAEGEKFDPFRHEVVAREVNETHPENSVIAVTRKGYVLQDKVIRPAMVKIAIRENDEKTDSKVLE